MATRMVERTNPASYIQDFINDYVQNRNRTRLTNIEHQQADDQRRQTDGQLKYWNDTAKLGQDTLGDSSRKSRAEAMWTQLKPLVDSGDHQTVQRIVTEEVTRDPSMRDYLAALATQRMNTPLEDARMNSATFAKNETAKAASGDPDAQARNTAFKLSTGEQMEAPVFADQQQRQPLAAPPKANTPAAQTAYSKYLRRKGGEMTSAEQDQQASTQITMNREDNATRTAIADKDRASNEKIQAGKVEAKTAKPSSGLEKRSLSFYMRAKDALEQLESGYEGGKPLHEQVGNKGVVGQAWMNYAPNVAQPEENQLYTQAQRQFTEARLRKDSGAAIPEHEYKNDRQTYFAQPGDTPAVIERKKRARQNILEALKFESGRAYAEHYGDEEDADPLGILK